MKAARFLVLLASIGTTFAPFPTVRAQQALRVDTAGNPTAPLNVGGANVTGTLAPARLGTGTPTSGTVLRGDGTWAGTTATGNTVAATGNLLMGDGSGNATAVVSSVDLQRTLQMRADTFRNLTVVPNNLLGTANLVIRNGTVNADGTLTIPANDYIQWSNPETANGSGAFAQAPHYAYAAATTDRPVGQSAGFYIHATYPNGLTFSGDASGNPEPGVSRYVFTNNVGTGDYTVFVTNATSSPITIYPPVMTLADVGVLPMQSFAESVIVPPQPVADLDFTRFASADRTGRYLAEKQTTLAADSVTGVDTNAGTLYAPKLTLKDQTLANGGVVGLYRGGLFRDSLPLAAITSPHGISVQDVALGSAKALPVVSALDPVNNAGLVANGDGTYSYQYTAETNVANDGYQNVYVVEINTTTEPTTPVASRRRMTDVTSSAACASTVGSAFVSPFGASGSGGWLAQIHPSDGLAPGSGSYRYEVVARFAPAAYSQQTIGDTSFSGLELVGSSDGYGSLAGPTGTVADRLAILHCSTHGAVLGGGSLQRSVFYESGDATPIQLAWYAANPAGTRWTLNNCLFYANVGDRAANCLIAHSSGGQNFDRGDIADCAFLGARWSNGSLQGQAIDYVNVSAGTINRVYVQAVENIFGVQMPLAAETKNSVFRQVNMANVQGSFHDNIVLAESGSDPNNSGNRAPIAIYLRQNAANASNDIFWARGLTTGVINDGGATGIQTYPGVTTGTVSHNIIVLDPALGNQPLYGNFGGATGLSMDYNLVVNLAPLTGGFLVLSPGGNEFTWAAYLAANPTLDQHSMYVDLSADPRGIQALFVDPINGDFRWAQTDVARRCAAYCAANNVGPAAVTSRWPLVPTVDEAVRLITGL